MTNWEQKYNDIFAAYSELDDINIDLNEKLKDTQDLLAQVRMGNKYLDVQLKETQEKLKIAIDALEEIKQEGFCQFSTDSAKEALEKIKG